MPPAYPQADEMYEQWMENGGQMPQAAPSRVPDMPVPQYTYNNCRMQNVAWQGQLEDFNDMQRGLSNNGGMSYIFSYGLFYCKKNTVYYHII